LLYNYLIIFRTCFC